ncbi:major tail protein [Streptomyces phage Rowa]|uniref:Major tail protein n=1 Tax=Streptomyces phage Rowa TaxID=2059883 RepID=A0A2H5BLU0_9CAUD|nr:major tail protein [Streptomyces phage Rowa]AUG87277.1 major tail protein [Streptomyces phage Rowa]
MSGNVNNPRLWEGADLWTAPVATALPASLDDAMTSAPTWKAVGLLSEDGASESRDEDSTDFYAWGGKLIRTKRSKHKRTITVTCLEDNLVVFGLVNPGSTVTTAGGTNTRTVKIPKSDKRSFVLELHDGDITRRRHIPQGEVTAVGEVTLSEADLQAFELTITIYPTSDDVLYVDYDNDTSNAAA